MFENQWASRLGLAVTPLFGRSGETAGHTAMLDGVAGSFVLSHDQQDYAPDFRDLSWSAMMRNHVLVDGDTVRVSPSTGGQTDRIALSAVENDLEGFLRYLEGNGQQAFDVVDHVISTFQALRSSMDVPEQQHLDVFLALLANRLANPDVSIADLHSLGHGATWNASEFGVDEDAVGLARELPASLVQSFYEHLSVDRRTGRELIVDLTIRHAGAELFQAAHLAPPVARRQNEFWGLGGGPIRIRPHSLKEVAYTPVGLARSIAEQVLFQASPYPGRELIIMDPACGSGSFLVEALAALERVGWRSPVKLVGVDISSRALATARFAVACATMLNSPFEVKSEFIEADFLAGGLPALQPDVVLMNPPFRAWPDMETKERELVRSILGRSYRGRPDKSMAFVQRAVEIAGPEAVLGVILPVGVVSGDGARPWREALAERAAPAMIATFGDHSLFRFATVSVSALVLDKGATASSDVAQANIDVQMVWSSERTGAASQALRTLRKGRRGSSIIEQSGGTETVDWNLYSTPSETLALKPSWLPAPGLVSSSERAALTGLEHVVSDLFRVYTGVRAGERKAFLLESTDFAALPAKERAGFRPVAEKQAIAGGAIAPTHMLFSAGESVDSEVDLQSRFPTYYSRYLKPWKEELSRRNRAGERWWLHSEPRNSWKDRKEPRIVSRQWFRDDGFAVDTDGTYAVVQGFAWFPKEPLRRALATSGLAVDMEEVLRLYAIMMSSDVFFRVCREYSTSAAGGQIALQQKYLNNVPLPLLPTVMRDRPHLIDEMTVWGSNFPELEQRNRFAAICYGFDRAY